MRVAIATIPAILARERDGFGESDTRISERVNDGTAESLEIDFTHCIVKLHFCCEIDDVNGGRFGYRISRDSSQPLDRRKAPEPPGALGVWGSVFPRMRRDPSDNRPTTVGVFGGDLGTGHW